MDESMKKPFMIAIVVVCFVLAGVITYLTWHREPSGLESLARGEMWWVKCANRACGAEYQMDRVDYFKQLEERGEANPDPERVPRLICQKCGEASVLRAVKCEKCGQIFFYGTVATDFADRCPKCRYSKEEAMREQVRQ